MEPLPGAWRGWSLTSWPRWKMRTSARSARTWTRLPMRLPGTEYSALATSTWMIAMNLRRGVDRHVVAPGRRRQPAGPVPRSRTPRAGGAGWCRGSVARPAGGTTARRCLGRRRDRRSVSPAKKELRTNGTVRSTRGLSCGRRTRAGSIRNPLAWAYSTNAWLNRGSSGSASSTTADRLSGITVAKIPPKNAQAASNPSITASVVWWKRQPHEAVPADSRR